MITQKQKKSKIPVTVGNRTFNSITDFCAEFGLKYSTVNRLLRKGKLPDEILAMSGNLPTGTRYGSDSALAQKCSYDGVEYPSLVVAADVLDLPLHKITYQQQENGLSLNKAIAAAVDEEIENNPDYKSPKDPRHKGPITIAGVTYKSMQAALVAYGMNFSTVRSRMERYKISFPEALHMGKKERRHIIAYESSQLYRSVKTQADIADSCQAFTLPADDKDIFVRVNKILSDNAYQPANYYHPKSQTGIICFYEQLSPLCNTQLIMLLFSYPQNYYPLNVEIIMPCLLSPNIPDAETKLKLLAKLNELHGKYLNAVINLVDNKIAARWLYTITSSSVNIRQFLVSLHKFIGTTSAAFDELEEFRN